MMKPFVMLSLSLGFLASFPIATAATEDGIYLMVEDGKGTEVKNSRGDSISIGTQAGKEFGPAEVWSMNNQNDRFRVQLSKVPVQDLEKTMEKGFLVLCIDGVCERLISHSDARQAAANGGYALMIDVNGRENAQKVAQRLGCELGLRKHPGHQLVTSFSPKQKQFKIGEPMMLEMRIENVGKTLVRFMDGGQQRGPRNNQFGFIAEPPHPDTGDHTNFGGMAALRTLKPGDVFNKEVDISKWYTFEEDTSCEITGLFELEFYEEDFSAKRLWEEVVVGKCFIRVVK
ncbi:MAG: hypothetical protein AAF483_04970 [Planctomycetota bacterium]